MESAIGYQLTDDEFEALWERQYANMRNASDYAHYNITSAAIIATDYPPSGWDFIEWAKRRLANAYTGGSDTSREDMAGWLGDATIKTDSESHVSFTQDDYKADLDAENVTNLMKVRGISYHEAEKIYFDMYFCFRKTAASNPALARSIFVISLSHIVFESNLNC